MATLKSRIGAIVIPLLPIGRRRFDVFRYELNALAVRVRNSVNPFFYKKVRSLEKSPILLLNIGSGGKGRPNWVNIELATLDDTTISLDVRHKLPFGPETVDFIFIEHVFEHLDFYDDVPRVLRDWWRVLKRGGGLRIVVPDAERFIKAYHSTGKDDWASLGWDLDNLPDDILTKMNIINHVFHQKGEHLFAYDYETLKAVLVKAGFRAVERRGFNDSSFSNFVIDQEIHRNYSLYVEAIK